MFHRRGSVVRTAPALALVVAVIAVQALAQTQAASWVKQAPIPTWYNLQGITALSPTEAWIASAPLLGDVGQLAHTTDAGRSWTVVDLPRQVNAVFFLDPLRGWAAGNQFFHTVDGGQTWIEDEPFGTIYDLYFLDAQHGWASGNGSVTYRTTDGGEHWSAVGAPGGSTIGSIWFADQMNGWAVNLEGQVFRSTNGGQGWTLTATLSGTNFQMIQFFDAQEGWVIGSDQFHHTTDGGDTWTPSAVPAGTWAHSARFFDRMRGVAVGEGGNIVRTENGGESWETIQPIGSGQRLWDVEYAHADTVFLAGDFGVISRSIDGGAGWSSIQSGGALVTHGFDRVDAQHAWSAQDAGEIAYTTNGGTQWIRSRVAGFDEFGHLMAVSFSDRRRGWAAGGNDFFGGSRGIISRSSDGGKSWRRQFVVPDFTFNGIEAIDARTGVAVGSFDFVGGGLVVRTTDGGASWQNVTPAAEGFRDVFFIDASTGWIVGANIYKSTDGGAHWTRQHGTPSSEFDAISFADPQNGWATGFNNVVLHTVDGGANWTAQAVPAPPVTAFTGVTAVNATTAWVAGWYGVVAVTRDGGQTWRREVIPGAEDIDFEDALFIDGQRGWVGGNIGIWKRSP
jgi:photosystem II stability/assembly factor-like uncharacterized protein